MRKSAAKPLSEKRMGYRFVGVRLRHSRPGRNIRLGDRARIVYVNAANDQDSTIGQKCGCRRWFSAAVMRDDRVRTNEHLPSVGIEDLIRTCTTAAGSEQNLAALQESSGLARQGTRHVETQRQMGSRLVQGYLRKC